jgi:hypothetical protein
LLWALKIIPELLPYDQEASHELVNALPANSVEDLIKQAHLRPQEEIKKQRNIAELWHWRARTRRLQEEGYLFQLPGGYTIEQILAGNADAVDTWKPIYPPIEDARRTPRWRIHAALYPGKKAGIKNA